LNLILTSKLAVATVPRNRPASAGDRRQVPRRGPGPKMVLGQRNKGGDLGISECDYSGCLYSTRGEAGEEPRRGFYDAN
jgi:hypothetical protein